ncbi:hypothetical protein [Parvularcula lutaonensis]|uniref:Haem-binding uptake Tiki superfamily ChaN domain-containing protein n=1 Tax=Parvularcula lutaonensis TaxID=491923 RepID=A0ABV7ME12_9PROT|nr:hypothetical protein [Parvularcula lutaonensis]GGY54380.1 hypothetical protein GCM10007148_24960 [Parvularcula lutaonensis]
MLVRIAELKRSGLDIEVVPFVKVSPEAIKALQSGDQSLMEQGYADEILSRTNDANRTIVLVGSIHAAKAEGQYPFVTFPPMASLFPDGSISLDFVHDGGTAWTMRDRVGASRPAKPSRVRPSEIGYPRIVFDEDLLPFFDGYLYVGPLTASLPVLMDSEEGE